MSWLSDFALAEHVSGVYCSHLEFSPRSDSTTCALPGWEVTAAPLSQPRGRNRLGGQHLPLLSALHLLSAQHRVTSTLHRVTSAQHRGRGCAVCIQSLSIFMDQEETPPTGEREEEMERGRRVLPGE